MTLKPESRSDAINELVLANRILARQGILDAFGHVSRRSPDNPDGFLISRSRAPGMVEPDDILELDLDGRPVDDDRAPYLERFIHSAIYSARPDVQSIVHSHAPAVIPFTVTSTALRPVVHVAGFLGGGVARFDTRDIRGEGTDLLVSDAELGVALADALGNAPVVLMRGHGFVVVGENLPMAVFKSIYTQVNAKIQIQANALGGITYLSDGEAAANARSSAAQVGRAWPIWVREVEAKLAPDWEAADLAG